MTQWRDKRLERRQKQLAVDVDAVVRVEHEQVVSVAAQQSSVGVDVRRLTANVVVTQCDRRRL